MSQVYFSPLTSLYEDDSPGTLIVGTPGSGKTYFLLTMALETLMMGANLIYLDGKNDSTKLKKLVKIDTIDINDIEKGSLNPFHVLKDIDTNTLLSLIECMCGGLSNEDLNAISPIVKDFVQHYRREGDGDFLELANYLYSSDNQKAQEVGNLIKTSEDSKYGKLILSHNIPERNPLSEINGSKIISLLGMDFPDHANVKEYTPEERFTSSILYIICKLLREKLQGLNNRPTIIMMDEAQVLLSSNGIISVTKNLLRLGRSLRIGMLLASHNTTGFPKDIDQFLSTKFMFKMESLDETEDFLNRFDLAKKENKIDRDSIIKYITNLTKDDKGKCFMIDRYKRGAFIQIKGDYRKVF